MFKVILYSDIHPTLLNPKVCFGIRWYQFCTKPLITYQVNPLGVPNQYPFQLVLMEGFYFHWLQSGRPTMRIGQPKTVVWEPKEPRLVLERTDFHSPWPFFTWDCFPQIHGKTTKTSVQLFSIAVWTYRVVRPCLFFSNIHGFSKSSYAWCEFKILEWEMGIAPRSLACCDNPRRININHFATRLSISI